MSERRELPKYQLLAQQIRSQYIAPAGEHTALPAERTLQTTFAVSRDTVRRAFKELEAQGLIYQVQGSGTFVAPRGVAHKAPSLRSFTDDMSKRGHTPHSLTLLCHLVEAPLGIQRDLQLLGPEKVIEIRRLRQADGSPIALETAFFLPAAFAHMQPQISHSLDAQMQASGFQVATASVNITATNLTQAEASLLEVPLGAAALRAHKIGCTVRGLPVESTTTLYRGDRYDYELQVNK